MSTGLDQGSIKEDTPSGVGRQTDQATQIPGRHTGPS